ncbi:MAG TPA: phosphoenolpyruvate--protein phosphotransferase [Arenimonas sp.]|nr:phosphoenolpyruvate--protein phosphotransferase [Arenimonas sp.]
MRRLLLGQGASRGIAVGRVRIRQPHALAVSEQRIDLDEVPAELTRLHRALDSARAELHGLRERLHGALAHEVGEFVDLHAMILDDPDLRHGLEDLVGTGLYSADYALKLQRDKLASVFAAMDDDYFRSRLEDLDHVVGRVHAALQRRDDDAAHGLAGAILVCHNVAPSELPELQAHGVIGIVCAAGSPLSHSAILARSLRLPLVVGAAELLAVADDGDALALDGGSGELVLDPDDDDLRDFRALANELEQEAIRLSRLIRQPTRTRDGSDIRLQANAESLLDVSEARQVGADGIGLYRTEFLFLQRNEPPGEDEQYQLYRELLGRMDGKPVTLRALDLGSDKTDQCGIALRDEDNPALGVRGLRLLLAHEAIFMTQLRAMLRAAADGHLRILLPMVSSREELIAAHALLQRARDELEAEDMAVAAHVDLGAMIEVPAAALALPQLADLVDFVSVGTNDLVQYLLAADRGHEGLGDLYSPLHPAVVRLLHQLFAYCGRRKLPISVCGEMAGDPSNVPLLLALGLTDFSLAPEILLAMRERIRACDRAALRKRAPLLLRARDRSQIQRWLLEHTP